MFKLFKRTAQTPTVELEEPVKTYPKWSIFTYDSARNLKKLVAPDFESGIMNVKRDGDVITVFCEEGYIDLPADKVIVVHRYFAE